MTKNFITGFERETLQGLNSEYDCIQCKQPITNPICHSCMGNEINKWLGFYPSVKKKMMFKVKKYVQEVNNSAVSSIGCVSCKSKKAALCPYCFTDGIFRMLKHNNVDKMVIMDFLSIFNFDMCHEGYIAEAAEQGLY